MSTVIIPEREALKLACQKCAYDWVYTGASKFRASCPNCGTTVRFGSKYDSKTKTKEKKRVKGSVTSRGPSAAATTTTHMEDDEVN